MGQSSEWISVVAIEKGAFASPSTKVADFTFFYLYIYKFLLLVQSENKKYF